MTCFSVLQEGVKRLKTAEIENADFDAKQLFLFVFSLSETEYLLKKNSVVSDVLIKRYFDMIEMRKSHIPLQYILGKWDFMGLEFFVGEGVLIPRPETELLVEQAVSALSSYENPVVYDLCAGSGCIGLSIAKSVPAAEVYMIEKSNEAFTYLKRNFDAFSLENTNIINGNIFNDCSCFSIPVPDLIISNPPYVKTNDLNFLQTEVKLEPSEALDGGDDGLFFYRVLSENWFGLLKRGGKMLLECGEDQSRQIAEFFRNIGETTFIEDYNKIERIVSVLKL